MRMMIWSSDATEPCATSLANDTNPYTGRPTARSARNSDHGVMLGYLRGRGMALSRGTGQGSLGGLMKYNAVSFKVS